MPDMKTGLVKNNPFYLEVEHRVQMLESTIQQRSVSVWCGDSVHLEKLNQLCEETAVFMNEGEAKSQAWRAEQWSSLYERFPEVLDEVLSLSGNKVLKQYAMKGEMYAGGVLHLLLKKWLVTYGRRERGQG